MSHIPGRAALVVILFLILPRSVASQGSVPPVGTSVRVTAPSVGLDEVVGRLDAVTSDFVQIGGLRVDRDLITRLEVQLPVSNFLRFTGIGLLTGVVVGGGVCLMECRSDDSDISKGGFLFLSTVAAGGAGRF